MKRETDGRAAALAAAAVAAACFAARPTPTLPRLEPGFGKPRRAAALPSLPRGEALRGPTAQQRFDEILHDAPADDPGAIPAAPPGAGWRRVPPEAGPARAGSKNESEAEAPLPAPAAREPSPAAKPRAGSEREAGPPGRESSQRRRELAQDRAEAAVPRRRPIEMKLPPPEFPAGKDARAPSAPRARHSFRLLAAGARENEGAPSGREGSPESAASSASDALSRADREASLFGREKKAARRPGERRPRQSRRAEPLRGERRRRRRDEPRERMEEKARRFRPLLLGELLGPRALRPPPPELEPPPAPALARPARGPGGKALPAAPAGLAALDGVDPAALASDRRKGKHWDGDEFHDGDVRGLARGAEWLWLRRAGADWWAFAGGGAQVRRDGVWWVKSGGIWFVVHDGAPWAWRSFQDWNAQGLFHPASGTEMVYSRDFARVALVTPGQGAEVFDAETGRKLAVIPETRMPPRRRPKAPERLPLPADVFAK